MNTGPMDTDVQYIPLHHGESDGFDAMTVAVVVGVLVGVAAMGLGIWWLVRRRRYG